MATTKPKTAAKKTAAKPKTAAAKKTVKTVKPVATPVETKKVDNKGGIFKGFFSKKYDKDESILTIFKTPNIYGSALGEIIGVMLLTLVMFSLSLMGIANIAMYAFALIAILVAVYAFSGAQLNPIVTVGMMATRRMSVIRGIVYIVAQIIGAWLGWMIFNAFHLVGAILFTVCAKYIGKKNCMFVIVIAYTVANVYLYFAGWESYILICVCTAIATITNGAAIVCINAMMADTIEYGE